ncbi:hypothetical protein CAPTEDRAFT_204916 [Capitella teleta]|uniref:Uncharacterized protein n=1 Tax=Capitella teleta TaxID=283909 RepID=R7TUC0_CAPTE|nr:hypothetical protein CAPTEDRAFT_204916 [Capitella teleta]|eukprot:ELT95061.1 hypothetical protein CAPTEDRAFT_204916 [Capitella teleta]
MAEKMKIKVTNNDMSFKFADRSVNDGCLHVDGLQLSKCGTNKKLVTNMNLTLKGSAKGDPSRNKSRNKTAKNTERVQEIPEAMKHTGSSNGTTDDWLPTRSKRSTGKQKRQFNKTQRTPSPTRNSENTRGHCWHCCEEYHSHKNCRSVANQLKRSKILSSNSIIAFTETGLKDGDSRLIGDLCRQDTISSVYLAQ